MEAGCVPTSRYIAPRRMQVTLHPQKLRLALSAGFSKASSAGPLNSSGIRTPRLTCAV